MTMGSEYRILEPEVAGGYGKKAVLDYSTVPPTCVKLHYEFAGWLGDDLLETTPCFIVTVPLKESLIRLKGTGYSFDEVVVSKSESFQESDSRSALPPFAWWKIHGQAGHDDAGLDQKHRLVVSDNLLSALKQHNIAHCTIRRKPFSPPTQTPRSEPSAAISPVSTPTIVQSIELQANSSDGRDVNASPFWCLYSPSSARRLAEWVKDEVETETFTCPLDKSHQGRARVLSNLSIALPGKSIGDFVCTRYGDRLVQDSVVELFKSHGFTGWKVKPAKARYASGVGEPPRLWELVATGWGGIASPE